MNISLIIPCYNEELNIQKGVLDKIGNYTAQNDIFGEVIIIDDGSTDSSKALIKKKYLPIFPKFRLVENRHQGKAIAVITGIKEAVSEYVIFSDFDLATPIEETKKIINEFNEGKNIVVGSRAKKRKGAPLIRKIESMGFVVIRNILVGLNGVEDTQCGFKGFKREAALKIINTMRVFTYKKKAKGSSVSAGFDIEFLFLARKLGYGISEVPVQWRHVETKNVTFVKDSIDTIKDLVSIRLFDMKGKYS